jgi:lipid-A-disaccharide synthase
MEQLGCTLIEKSEKMSVVGVAEVVAHWNVIKNAFNNLLATVRREKTDLAILLDYPDFNLRLARKLHQLKVPVFYYISPQVWAWRTGRVELIKKVIQKMLVLFPFEVDFYKKHNVEVSFVGHPLLDELPHSQLSSDERKIGRSKYNVREDEFLVGLLPGSRESELKNNFEVQLRAAELLSKEYPKVKFIILVAPSLEVEFVKTYIAKDLKFNYALIKEDPLKMIQLFDVCLVASGTATLVTALLEIPMVIMYRMNTLSAYLARKLVKGKFFGMPNLIMDQKVVPELFQEEATAAGLAAEVKRFMLESDYYQNSKNKLKEIKTKLGSQGATVRVVDEMEKALHL